MMNEFRLIPGSVVELAMPAAQLQMVTSYQRNIPSPFPLEMPTMQQESDEISSCVFPQVECIMGLAWEPSGVPLHNSSLCSLSILIEWKSVQTIIVQSSIELELKSRPLLVERETFNWNICWISRTSFVLQNYWNKLCETYFGVLRWMWCFQEKSPHMHQGVLTFRWGNLYHILHH